MPHNPPLRLFPHEDETIEGVGRALREGKTTCAAVLERCFHQIDLWDEKVKAWVYLDRAGAMAQARALDEELKAGTCRGPLHGIPFGIKDIIDVQGMPTACGFPPWRDRVMEKDAEIVRRLREGGAVILGKTVTTQFAWIDPPPTRNPWNLERTPGGSSSGSAAAVATGMCLGAIGTQTGGSIIRPAAFCGVAGLKPGYGDFPIKGVFPFSPSLDHVGVMARSALDLHLAYEYLCRDNWELEYRDALPEPRAIGDISHGLEFLLRMFRFEQNPQLIRPRGFYDRRAEPSALAAFESTLDLLAAAGAEIVDFPEDAVDFEEIVGLHRTIMAAEAAATHESYYQQYSQDYSRHIRALVEEGLATPVTSYVRAGMDSRERGLSLDRPFERFRSRERPTAIVIPSAIGPAPDTTTTGNPSFQAPWSYVGWPSVTIPAGLSRDGLPLGLQVISHISTNHNSIPYWCESILRRAHESKGE